MAKRKSKTKQTTANISMPATLRARVNRRVADAGFGNVSEYFRSLVRKDLQGLSTLEELIEEGLRSPVVPMDDRWLAERRRKVRERVGAARRRAG